MAIPVALFTYARPAHTRSILACLRADHRAAEADLTIFCDGARSATDQPAVAETRRLAQQAAADGGFHSCRVIERERNLGLAGSIVSGVSEMLIKNDRVVVVEDDLVTSPWFLDYLASGLETYADDAAVASIHAYSYPHRTPLPETFFLRGADCWGWATWRRAWATWEADGAKLMSALRAADLVNDFDFGGAAGNSAMLADQIAGRNDSWAIRWHAATFLAGMHTLFPNRPLCRNAGLDGSGSHCGVDDRFAVQPSATRVEVRRIPVCECPAAVASFASFHRQRHSPWRRIWHRIRRLAGSSQHPA